MTEAPQLKTPREAHREATQVIARALERIGRMDPDDSLKFQIYAIVDRVRSGDIESATFRLIDGELNVDMVQKVEWPVAPINLKLVRDQNGYPSLELMPETAANDDLENEGKKS